MCFPCFPNIFKFPVFFPVLEKLFLTIFPVFPVEWELSTFLRINKILNIDLILIAGFLVQQITFLV